MFGARTDERETAAPQPQAPSLHSRPSRPEGRGRQRQKGELVRRGTDSGETEAALSCPESSDPVPLPDTCTTAEREKGTAATRQRRAPGIADTWHESCFVFVPE